MRIQVHYKLVQAQKPPRGYPRKGPVRVEPLKDVANGNTQGQSTTSPAPSQCRFSTTQKYQNMKNYFRRQIEKLHRENGEFSGSEAVNILEEYLQANREQFSAHVVKRENAVKALPSCVSSCSAKAMLYLKNGKALNTIKDGLIVRDESFARYRIWELSKRCKKCEIVDYMLMLADEKGHYLGYNPNTNLMYLDQANHFNRFGKQIIQTIFEKLAKQFVTPQDNGTHRIL
ncbi:unnamed protein product [Cylicocyclus nassatus]|uniref:SGNH domain-containing protein n=1 Tax=Cylicocyclus nassatus TaxID=53992 RepID=A0AA36MCT3_CYLNA|nr:unnamed protein product [Cylicocyclus nassatus]